MDKKQLAIIITSACLDGRSEKYDDYYRMMQDEIIAFLQKQNIEVLVEEVSPSYLLKPYGFLVANAALHEDREILVIFNGEFEAETILYLSQLANAIGARVASYDSLDEIKTYNFEERLDPLEVFFLEKNIPKEDIPAWKEYLKTPPPSEWEGMLGIHKCKDFIARSPAKNYKEKALSSLGLFLYYKNKHNF